MTFFPIVARELRAEARNPVNFWQRVAAGAVLTVLIAWILSVSHMDANEAGKVLFARLHLAMLLLIAVLVPSMTSDCIARERREGTLGLLFLTPLSPVGLVLGKCLVRVVRALSIIAAVVAVMAIPFLLGGVTWVDLVSALSIQLCFVMIALAAGLLASAFSRSAMRSLVLAYALAGMGVFALVAMTGILFTAHLKLPANLTTSAVSEIMDVARHLVVGHERRGVIWGQLLAPGNATYLRAWLITLGELLALSCLLLYGCVWATAWLVRRRWRDEGPSEQVERLNRKFCTPVVMTGVLKKWLRRKLDRNPIGWLEQRRWTGRLVVWSWFAIVTSVYSYMLASSNLFYRMLYGVHGTVAWALTGAMMVTAAGSFRRERETGVMELLLVSPMDEWGIIFSRLRAIWGQFLPAVVLFLAVWFHFAGIAPGNFDASIALPLITSFFCLPIIGLYFSLRCRHFMSSIVLSVLLGYVAPVLLSSVVELCASVVFHVGVRISDDSRTVLWVVSDVAMGWWALQRLHSMLRLRTFSFERLMG